MTEKKGKAPEALPDEKLDEASGGLPAIQKVRDSAITDGTSNTATGGVYVASGDVDSDAAGQVLMGDGSVRTIKPGV